MVSTNLTPVEKLLASSSSSSSSSVSSSSSTSSARNAIPMEESLSLSGYSQNSCTLPFTLASLPLLASSTELKSTKLKGFLSSADISSQLSIAR
jgi:hypothetical protein